MQIDIKPMRHNEQLKIEKNNQSEASHFGKKEKNPSLMRINVYFVTLNIALIIHMAKMSKDFVLKTAQPNIIIDLIKIEYQNCANAAAKNL